jgi:hypothetical protein
MICQGMTYASTLPLGNGPFLGGVITRSAKRTRTGSPLPVPFGGRRKETYRPYQYRKLPGLMLFTGSQKLSTLDHLSGPFFMLWQDRNLPGNYR